MEKVDLIIAGVGVVAILATVLGVALYDDGLTAYEVRDGTSDLGTDGPAPVDASGTDFEFMLPNNTLGASFDVTVTVGGQSPGGAVAVTVVINEPDGTSTTFRDSFNYADGTATFTVASEGAWGEKPEDFRGDDAAVESRTITWDGPAIVEVFVDGPCAGPLPLPTCFDTYEAQVTGTAMTYVITPETPDPETA